MKRSAAMIVEMIRCDEFLYGYQAGPHGPDAPPQGAGPRPAARPLWFPAAPGGASPPAARGREVARRLAVTEKQSDSRDHVATGGVFGVRDGDIPPADDLGKPSRPAAGPAAHAIITTTGYDGPWCRRPAP